MIPAVLLFLGMMLLPESPRWLARKDRWEECHAVLTLVHGQGDPNSPFVLREYEEIKSMCEFERQNADVSYLELFKPNMLNRTHVGIFVQIWSQLTGMNVMSKCLPNLYGWVAILTVRSSVLHYLRLCYGRPEGQQQPDLLQYSIRDQRVHDRAGSDLG